MGGFISCPATPIHSVIVAWHIQCEARVDDWDFRQGRRNAAATVASGARHPSELRKQHVNAPSTVPFHLQKSFRDNEIPQLLSERHYYCCNHQDEASG
jgi:hypothetical protein